MGKATQDLRKEHDAILHVLEILDRMIPNGKEDAVKLQYYTELIDFIKIFADKCHHGKEENYLFVELVNAGVPNEGGPVGVMLHEHDQGREYIALMSKSVQAKDLTGFNAAAIQYRDLMRSHIHKENNVLFPIADQFLNDAKQDDLFEKFEQHEESVIGHGVHEKLHSMIHRWSEDFGLA